MKVVLMRKFAERIDGVDVSAYETGDVFDVPAADARLLMAERWAIPDRRHGPNPPPESDRRRCERGRAEDSVDSQF
jgi:hypothetical protein